MNFHFDHKKLSYFFFGMGLLLTISLMLSIAGVQSSVAAAGLFLFSSFSFPAFYLPFFLFLYGYLTYKNELYTSRIIVLSLTVIPFLTISLLFRILLSADGSAVTVAMSNGLGKMRAASVLGLLAGFELFLLYFLPRYFSYFELSEEEPGESLVERDFPGSEEDAFKEYAFKFPEPDDMGDFSHRGETGDSIDDIFTSILSGGSSEELYVPPARPTVIEPVREENPFENLESPLMESDPAIAALSEEDDLELGDYTYHKYEDRDPQVRTIDEPREDRDPQVRKIDEPHDEAEVKIAEIMAELDSVLSVDDDASDDWPEPAAADDDEYADAGYLGDRHGELDEFRDISSKLAPVEGEEGGVLREVKPRQKYPENYAVPVEGVLAEYPDDRYSEIDEDTRKAARVLEITLEEFKISAKVTGIKKGPVITMFELLPAPGVKISKITNLADNIALRLAASRVRIVAPIPGKHAVGIEVPNKKRAIVSFSEMVSAPEMKDQDMAVPIVLGKDIRGGTQVIDLTRTPHLLIAGATGSGKSVCVNSLICSILYGRSPADVKMILVDPKIVELKLYNDIPHLLTPVITDPKKAIQAIQWCLYEMERRYALLDVLGVREIRSYNRRVKERKLATTELPYLILVIDEFADLMATSGKELEAMIARLAAMSRAVGIHLVLATQRPSADVITGLIKANFPSRIAFMVASMMDSRIIIDSGGAEKLLGKGDMLFTSAWDPFPSRVQGAFMSEEEVERVVAYVKTLGAPEYIDDEIFIDADEDDEPSHSAGGSSDPLFNKALEIVGSAGKASASYLQRRLKIGYNRAARLVEQMEDMGIVGPQNGSKPREVIHMPDSSNY